MYMQLVTTGDGSHTLYAEKFDEHYHSTYGAYTESMHVFINAGMGFLRDRTGLTILEIGFGTGLNALLACVTAVNSRLGLTYHAVEKFPVDIEKVKELNYWRFLPDSPNPGVLFRYLHQAPWNA